MSKNNKKRQKKIENRQKRLKPGKTLKNVKDQA